MAGPAVLPGAVAPGLLGLVAVVTDSSACLDRAVQERHAIVVIPLRVLAGGAVADDEPGPLPAQIAAELRRGERLSTARPAPERFAAAYAAAAAAGASAIVSIHLSGELSGTIGSARLAAATAPVPVQVIDSRSIGAGLGLVVLAAAQAAAAAQLAAAQPAGAGHSAAGQPAGAGHPAAPSQAVGQPAGAAQLAAAQLAAEVAQAATRVATRLGLFFALDSQDQLHAGGRLAHPGGARPGGPAPVSLLRSRPLLHIADGRIAVLERVRTRSAARDRLTELAATFAAGHPARLTVMHLDNPSGAAALARQLATAIPAAGQLNVTEAGTAIRAHTGPGLLGVAVAALP
jgi:fatty acid-binding protein DegV